MISGTPRSGSRNRPRPPGSGPPGDRGPVGARPAERDQPPGQHRGGRRACPACLTARPRPPRAAGPAARRLLMSRRPAARPCRHARNGGRDAVPHLARWQLPAAGLADRPGAAGGPVPAPGQGPRAVAGGSCYLDEAQQDATLLAIRAQEDAGLDIITDGEIRRESYSNRFATALDGVDIDNPGTALDRSGHPNPVPRIVGPIWRRHPVQVDDLTFLRAHTGRTVKVTVPGPFTMAQQAQNDYYPDREAAAFGYAEAVNEEVRDLFAAAPTSSSSTSPICRPGRTRPAATGCGGEPGARGRGRHHRRAHLLRVCGDHPRPPGRLLFLPELAAAAPTRCPSRPRSLAWTARCSARWRQDSHPGRARPERPHAGDARPGAGPGQEGAGLRARRAVWCSPRTAG